MAIVGPAGGGTPGTVPGNNYFGLYNDLKSRSPTVSVTNQEVDYPALNAITPLPYERWTTTSAGTIYWQATFAAARSIDSWGVYGHNLHTVNGTVSAEYSTNGSTWTTFTGPVTLTTSAPVFRVETAVLARWWRFKFESTGVFSVGVLYFGKAFQLPAPPGDGFVPPPLGTQDKILNNIADKGNILGRSIVRNSGAASYSFPIAEIAWSRTDMQDARDHMLLNPFFWIWDSENYPGDSAYCYTEGSNAVQVQYNQLGFMSLNITMKALIR